MSANVSARKYDVALSFAGEDRKYVELVAVELQKAGVAVFYDRFEEASLWGKNLYEHLRRVYIDDATFTVVFVSEAYAKKLWTTHERESAQSRAFAERSEYILPARFDDTKLPGLLETTAYVDLRSKPPEALAQLVLAKLRERGDSHSSQQAMRENPICAAALDELEQYQTLSNAVSEALLAAETAPSHLALLLTIAIEKSSEVARPSLGRFAIDCIKRFDVGYEAVDACLRLGVLNEDGRYYVGAKLACLTDEKALIWAHGKLVGEIRSDIAYHSFLQKHIDFVASRLETEMARYLLVPNRGPVDFNVDSLFLAAVAARKPAPYLLRIKEWLYDGLFDVAGASPRCVEPKVLYHYINYAVRESSSDFAQDLIEASGTFVRSMLKQPDTRRSALYHLLAMRIEDFVGLSSVLQRLDSFSEMGLAMNQEVILSLLRCNDQASLDQATILLRESSSTATRDLPDQGAVMRRWWKFW